MKKSIVFFLVLFLIGFFFVTTANSFAQVMRKTLLIPQPDQAVIAAVTPRAVTLKQGGPAALVTVDGKYLETILSVQAIREGHDVGEITAKLVQPWPASQKIELQAGANAPVAQDYQLRFVGKAGLREFRVDVPLSLFRLEVAGQRLQPIQQQMNLNQEAQQAINRIKLPDLIISSVNLKKCNTPDAYDWDVTLQNIGYSPASFVEGVVLVTCDAYPPSQWGQFVYFAPPGGLYLTPGATWKSNNGGGVVISGLQKLIFTADPSHKLFESNENNNTYIIYSSQATPPPQPPLPDLTITSVSVDPPSGPSSTTFTITAVVKNIGEINYRNDGTCVFVESSMGGTQQLCNLSVGESKTFTFKTGYSMPPGTKTVTCTADTINFCKESDESNNKMSATFIVEQP